MADDLPTEYDVIVLGTGLSESILAAAFSRIGLKVLHLDRNEYYSGDWASFTFDGLQKWIEKSHSCDESTPRDDSGLLKEGESFIGLKPYSSTITNVQQSWLIRDAPAPVEQTSDDPASEGSEVVKASDADGNGAEDGPQDMTTLTAEAESSDDAKLTEAEKVKSKVWTVEEVQSLSRRFNIDLSPKLLYCRGSLVELLISSDIAKYCEFKVVSRVLTWMNEKLEQVPCSRADVFATKSVSMIEKRVLMKFLQFCLDYENHSEEFQGFEDRPFKEYLASRKMSANVQHYVIHAIAMLPEDIPTLEALKACQKFLMSLGRYGNTAFLWPLYGSGELPQSFCRMCAVFGGVYYLRRPIEQLIVNSEKKAVGVVSDGQRLNANWIVMNASFASCQLVPNMKMCRSVSRAIYLTDRSILDCGTDQLTLLRLPATADRPEPISVIELTQSALACPADMVMVHMTCIGKGGDPKEDFKKAEEMLFQSTQPSSRDEDDPRPKVLWCLYFSRQDSNGCDLTTGDVSNVFITTGPDETLHFEEAVKQTKPIFDKVCPGEEFLPKAPNPEDIIFEGNEGQSQDAGFGAQGDGDASKKDAENAESEMKDESESKEGSSSQKEEPTSGAGAAVESTVATPADKTEAVSMEADDN